MLSEPLTVAEPSVVSRIVSSELGTSGGRVAMQKKHLVRVLLAFAAIYLIWGSTFLGIRVAIQTIPAMLMAGVRWIFAGTVLYGFLRWRGAARPRGRSWLVASLMGGSIIFAGNGSVTYAEQFIPSGTLPSSSRSAPALMAVMGWLSGAAARRVPVWIGIALATWGVWVIVEPAGVTVSRVEGFAIAIILVREVL